MTRRSGGNRVTGPAEQRRAEPAAFPSMRQRSPWAFWVAVIGTAAMVISTFAASLSVFL